MTHISTSGAGVRTFLTGRVGDNAVYWSLEEMKDSFNEALNIWQALTGESTTSFEIPVSAGAVFYEVPHQIGSTNRVLWGTTPLSLTSLEGLDLSGVDWYNAVSGTPREWAPVGINMIAIYPPASTGFLTFEGISEPPLLLNDGDKMDLGDDLLEPLLAYGHAYLAFKEGGAEYTAASQLGMQRMLGGASLRNSQLIATAAYRRIMGKDQDEVLRKPRSSVKTAGARG